MIIEMKNEWILCPVCKSKTRVNGVDEITTPQIRIDDRADFNSNRRFYHLYFILFVFVFPSWTGILDYY